MGESGRIDRQLGRHAEVQLENGVADHGRVYARFFCCVDSEHVLRGVPRAVGGRIRGSSAASTAFTFSAEAFLAEAFETPDKQNVRTRRFGDNESHPCAIGQDRSQTVTPPSSPTAPRFQRLSARTDAIPWG